MHKSITQNGQEVGHLEYIYAADELQILDIFIQPEYRRQGLAQGAIKELFTAEQNLTNAYLEVRISNQAAQNLYTKLGFEKTGIRKNYYHDPVENAVLMKKILQK